MILNAVLCVWNEEDIIESTVKHLFAQGCSNVFIVDNDSSDNTVKKAIHSGCKLAATFKTEYFSEDQKIVHLNEVVRYINETTSEDKIWWLYVDADEFPSIEHGTLINYLNLLDSSVRALHGYIFNHIPAYPPYHVQGYHPADFQPLCTKSSTSKIPLLRYDRGKPHLWSTGGAHDYITHNEPIPTIKDFLQIHHFPYRNPEFTFKRLKKLVDRNNIGMYSRNWYKEYSNQIAKSILAEYESRYKQLHNIYSQNKYLELKTHKLIYNYKSIIRWYNNHLYEPQSRRSYENSIWRAMYYFFMEEYDFAVCTFNDIFNNCNDINIKLWLMIKIAECLTDTGGEDAQNILSSIMKYGNSELISYIKTHLHQTAHKNSDPVYCLEFYSSVFPPGVEEKYKKIMKKIQDNINIQLKKNTSNRCLKTI